MKFYEFTLKHDHGKVTLRTRATSLLMAQNIICASEGAPKSAIESWRVIPTARQIKRTQNLMRCL